MTRPRHAPTLHVRSGLVHGLAAALVVLALRPLEASCAPAAPAPGPQARPVTPRGPLEADEQATVDLFERASPSVVNIDTSRQVVRSSWFSRDLVEIPRGTGTGFVWDEEGHVVTNFHVVQDAVLTNRQGYLLVRDDRPLQQEGARIVVTLSDHSQWNAQLLGVAPNKDLAVIKVDAPDGRLRPLAVGSSSDLRVGQKVFAIGNPFGLDQTLTTGIISGLDRDIRSLTDRRISGVIQTDAAINPGNSGGPLLDSAGRLIGVNTAILSPSGAYAGIGYAIPVDTVNEIVPQLVRRGRVVQPGFGIEILQDVDARRNGVRRGVVVRRVQPDSAAERAGILGWTTGDGEFLGRNDVIVAIGPDDVRGEADLRDALNQYAVGDVVRVVLERNGERRTVEVELQAID